MKFILIILAILPLFSEESIPIPPDARETLAEYERLMAEKFKAYDVANARAGASVVETLEKQKLSYMQNGKLDGANEVAAAIKKVKDGQTLSAIEGSLKRMLGAKRQPPWYMCEWTIPSTPDWWILIVDDNTFLTGEGVGGKWNLNREGHAIMLNGNNRSIDMIKIGNPDDPTHASTSVNHGFTKQAKAHVDMHAPYLLI